MREFIKLYGWFKLDCMLFTFEKNPVPLALGDVSGVASLITTDEQLQ